MLVLGAIFSNAMEIIGDKKAGKQFGSLRKALQNHRPSQKWQLNGNGIDRSVAINVLFRDAAVLKQPLSRTIKVQMKLQDALNVSTLAVWSQ